MAFEINSDLDLALRLAKAADMETTARFRSADLHVETKPDMTPVSDADTAAEQSMLDLLAVERPDDAILAEESGASGDSTRTWILDPIDGTKQFVRGLPSWATLVALRENDDTLVAVVSAPALGRLWWAAKGQGAWTDGGKAIAVSGVATLSESVLLHAELSGWDDVPGGPAKLVDLSRECWQSRGYGDFWIHCLVAEGAAEIAAEPGPSLWDLAAPALIVQEAGGRFTSLDGRDGPTHGSALATNGHLHDTVLSALNS